MKKYQKVGVIGVTTFLIGVMLVGLCGAQELRIGARSWIYKKFPVSEAIERFEKEHPDVKVRRLTMPKARKAPLLTAWMRGKTDYDLVIGGNPAEMAAYIGKDLLVDLSDLLRGHMDKERFVRGFLLDARFEKEGKLYYPILPFMGELTVVDVNKKIYQKAGLLDRQRSPLPPPSWEEEEFINYWEKLAAVSPKGIGLSVVFPPGISMILHNYLSPIQAMRGTIYATEKEEILDFQSQEAEKLLTILQEMYQRGTLNPNVGDENLELSNYKAGIMPAIENSHSRMIEAAETLGEGNTGFVLWPGAEKNGTISFTHSVSIPKSSPVADLAKKFIREQVFSRYFQQWSFNHYGKLPAMRDCFEDLKWFPEEAKKILRIAAVSMVEPKYIGDVELRRIMGEELHAAVTGGKKPKEALQAIRKKIEEREVDLTRMEYIGEKY